MSKDTEGGVVFQIITHAHLPYAEASRQRYDTKLMVPSPRRNGLHTILEQVSIAFRKFPNCDNKHHSSLDYHMSVTSTYRSTLAVHREWTFHSPTKGSA